MAFRYLLFKKFENKEYISLTDLPKINDHICLNLNNWTPNYHYWHNMYSYASKAYIVCDWKEERGRRPISKWEEAICKNKLVNFFDDPAHQRCSCATNKAGGYDLCAAENK